MSGFRRLHRRSAYPSREGTLACLPGCTRRYPHSDVESELAWPAPHYHQVTGERQELFYGSKPFRSSTVVSNQEFPELLTQNSALLYHTALLRRVYVVRLNQFNQVFWTLILPLVSSVGTLVPMCLSCQG